MKKWILTLVALAVLAQSAGWAQTNPNPKQHSRPPYSGPRKNSKGHHKNHPLAHRSAKAKAATLHKETPKSDHIVVR